MAEQNCCVCHVKPGVKVIGNRGFCEEHYNKAIYKRGGVWKSAGLAVLGLLIFVAAVVALDVWLKPQLTGMTLLIAGVVLTLVPAAVWLIFFYQQDRLEPEPVGQVARMFVIGLALAGAVGIPFTDQLLKVSDWLYRDTLTTILGSIFIIGGVQAFIVYAVVRYFIFDSPEFDERTDGVVYATAAGLGYATALNLQFILANGGAALGAGEVYVAEVALAQAAFGGLLGYFLGRAKLERDPIWWLPTGLVLTAVLNGLFNYLRTVVDVGTITRMSAASAIPSLSGLLLAGTLAIVVTVIVSLLINRDIARSLNNQGAAEADPTVGDRQASYAVIGTFVVLLAAGALVWNNAVNSTRAFAKDGFAGAYPVYYGDATGADEVLRVSDTMGTGAEFVITKAPMTTDLKGVINQLAGDRSTTYEVYKVLESSSTTVNGKEAVMMRFAYVDPGALTTGVRPEVREGVDYIVKGNSEAVIITMFSASDELPEVEPLFARFLNSLALP